ncbi:recombinase family protein [Pseudomonas sp. C11]|uniref:recombinase family protein n=1 Tax=Pseudomonas sp. C11 TaxID=3075550 RepID=UPI002AFDCD09|nr:recombinase family protein [Pseudomonas sp. C11]
MSSLHRTQNSDPPTSSIRAAAYVRMSTEHQQYSTENQLDTIRAYASDNDLEIVRVYTDSGKSGLSLDGRDALQRLLGDIESGSADFSIVLVYDVSRWGRFQDPDVSASYEVRCRQAGVAIEYCAEQFRNDGSLSSAIVKQVKRSMAAEYSRELSVKVFAGQSRLIGLGFRQGGPAGYGLRRQLVDQHGNLKTVLEHGEQKSLQTDRVVLVPGPESEQRIVREIYRMFVEEGRAEREVAQILNERGQLPSPGHRWTRGAIHQILVNEKYAGHNVWNKTSGKLNERRVSNPEALWVRADNAFPALVEPLLFNAAQLIIQSRTRHLTDDQILDALRGLLARKGYLSGLLIDEEEECPSSSTLRSRFGSLLRSYSLIGYTPARDYAYIEANQRLRELYPQVLTSTIQCIQEVGAQVEVEESTQLLWISQEVRASIVLCRCQELPSGSLRWKIRFDAGLSPDLTIAVRMQPGELEARDYYIFPAMDQFAPKIRLAEANARELELYRFDTLDILSTLTRRVALPGAA